MPRSVPPDRIIYILAGTQSGGGHRFGTNRSGKSEFPQDWDDDKIIREIESVANDATLPAYPTDRGTTRIEGCRDGIEIRVLVGRDGQTIITGFPLNTKINP